MSLLRATWRTEVQQKDLEKSGRWKWGATDQEMLPSVLTTGITPFAWGERIKLRIKQLIQSLQESGCLSDHPPGAQVNKVKLTPLSILPGRQSLQLSVFHKNTQQAKIFTKASIKASWSLSIHSLIPDVCRCWLDGRWETIFNNPGALLGVPGPFVLSEELTQVKRVPLKTKNQDKGPSSS